MTTWADVTTALKNRNLIRKSLDAIVLTAPKSTALPTTLLTSGNLVIPTGFKGIGWHSDAGLAWAREVENSELTGHGSVDPLRTDTRRVTNTLEVTALETNIQTLGFSIGVDIDKAGGSAGEVILTEPNTPKAVEFRMLALSVDDTDDGEIYFGKLFAVAKVTATSPGAWTDGDNAQSHGLTIQAYRDATAGFAVKHFIGGPGFEALREDMGWDPIAP
ncbi:MAG: hypothetical protein HOV78_11650 [Hamadaea sp.]|nr:hypothetical protein [Hamadaea sp.]